MKKVLVVLAAAGLLFAMSSCKKVCTCTFTVMGVSTSTEVNLEEYESPDIKTCSDLGEALTVPGHSDVKCK
ncbi:MAG: hypothetical protein J5709_05575 [Bacteroidales bacterium]|nr:hypothetical protein [Bacteroidales bacterium]